MEKMLTLEDVAALLGVPKATVYKWRYEGSGPVGFRVGRHVRYRAEDVEQWLTGQRDGDGDRAA